LIHRINALIPATSTLVGTVLLTAFDTAITSVIAARRRVVSWHVPVTPAIAHPAWLADVAR
jgi:hypothetical protein